MDIKCLICKKKIQDTKTLPFCSEKCKLVDLYNWFTGEYCIGDEKEELLVVDDREMPEKFWINQGGEGCE